MLTTLSPLADPFHPRSMPGGYSDLGPGLIYNNGVPSLAVPEWEQSKMIRSISDEAIDEVFPPTAEEAAELEAVEAFVVAMSRLAELEEKEEEARQDMSRAHLKRWEARRFSGLKGRPRAARTRTNLTSMAHRKVNLEESSIIRAHTNMVPYHDVQFRHRNYHAVIPKHFAPRTGKKIRKPIQQPRK